MHETPGRNGGGVAGCIYSGKVTEEEGKGPRIRKETEALLSGALPEDFWSSTKQKKQSKPIGAGREEEERERGT